MRYVQDVVIEVYRYTGSDGAPAVGAEIEVCIAIN